MPHTSPFFPGYGLLFLPTARTVAWGVLPLVVEEQTHSPETTTLPNARAEVALVETVDLNSDLAYGRFLCQVSETPSCGPTSLKFRTLLGSFLSPYIAPVHVSASGPVDLPRAAWLQGAKERRVHSAHVSRPPISRISPVVIYAEALSLPARTHIALNPTPCALAAVAPRVIANARTVEARQAVTLPPADVVAAVRPTGATAEATCVPFRIEGVARTHAGADSVGRVLCVSKPHNCTDHAYVEHLTCAVPRVRLDPTLQEKSSASVSPRTTTVPVPCRISNSVTTSTGPVEITEPEAFSSGFTLAGTRSVTPHSHAFSDEHIASRIVDEERSAGFMLWDIDPTRGETKFTFDDILA